MAIQTIEIRITGRGQDPDEEVTLRVRLDSEALRSASLSELDEWWRSVWEFRWELGQLGELLGEWEGVWDYVGCEREAAA
jgi:hypothetical protein